MKLRLFCFLSALFVVAGLLLPSGVYAADAPTSAPTVTVDDTTTTESCTNTQTTASTAVAVDATATSTDGDEPVKSDQCDDGNNDSNYSCVSWNS